MSDLVKQSILYDIYGELLNENQKIVYEYKVVDDLSFNEIGEELGLTRQATCDLFNRAYKKLCEYDDKLHLISKFENIQNIASQINETSKEKNTISLSQKIINLTKMEEFYGSKNTFKKIGTHT